MSTANSNSQDNLNSINQGLVDINWRLALNFLISEWRKLIVSSVIGALLGFGGWLAFSPYVATYVLSNYVEIIFFENSFNQQETSTNSATANTNNNLGIDLATWKSLQRALPLLATEILQLKLEPAESESLYQNLSNDLWWHKNVVPNYNLSKADTKNLTSISKELDAASGSIISFTLKIDSQSSEKAQADISAAANFFRTGGAYLQIRRLLQSYKAITISEKEEILRIITATKVELAYKKQRRKFLQDIYKIYPENNQSSNSWIGPIGVDSKFLSVQAQIAAVSVDINRDEEKLDRMYQRLAQLDLVKDFIDRAHPFLSTQFNGALLVEDLLSIESKLREKLPVGSLSQSLQLDEIRSKLSLIQARFANALAGNGSPIIKRIGRLKAIFLGIAAATFLMILFLLYQKFWNSFKLRGFLGF